MVFATSTDLANCDRKGSEGSIYYNTGTCATPVWVYLKSVVGDLNLGETENENENSSRDPAQKVRTYTEDKIDIEISGELQIDNLYEGNNFINSARSGGSARDFMILDGYITEVGVQGWRGKMKTFDRSRSYPESGPPRQTFKLRPYACTDCVVRPVRIDTASTAADYDPTTFVPAT